MELTNQPMLIWFVIGYGIFMLLLGVYYSKKINTSDDFILAGKSLGPIVLMGTLLATWVGSGSVTGGQNSMAYSFGIWPALMSTIPSLLGILTIFLISSKIKHYGKHTVAEILEIKYGRWSSLLAAIIIILAFVGIVSYQFQGLGFILSVSTGISPGTGTIIGAAIIIFLACIGGLMSVAPTDAVSAFLVIIGLVVAVPIAISVGGGWDQIIANVPDSHTSFTGGLSFLQLMGYYLPTLFLLLGDQNIYQRITASNNDKTTKRGTAGWIIGLIIATPTISLLAFISRSLFPDIDPGMAVIALTSVLPIAVGGILIAALTAFIVTTGNSYLLSAATSVIYDFFAKYIKRDINDHQKLVYTRVLIPVLGVIAFLLTMYFPTVLAVQMYAYTVYGAGITPALLAVFLFPQVTKSAGLSSMVTGLIVTLFWEFFYVESTGINSVIVSVPVAIIVLIIVTLFTHNKNSSRKEGTE
ncbi:sodium:proline symporter [Salimicrobium jeotgali]|uniref:Sodium:proline symporter n=1 Tax=Salimicrobium jeotgali TaxID=1230341 RepID=K2H4B9_9BACI|nr:sodium:solute symporter family protein [Salimicrobium jeotgali]AKG03448.1 sodium:proline symporter [Salimicrobium jeotgali]EKE30715.1 sodium:proline symporter [Salimicrobium jeotgali]MBM7697156.1 SSS family solute:Na+ symporter [Salimicrobium jeotgali]